MSDSIDLDGNSSKQHTEPLAADPNPPKSRWAYLKWIIWSAVAVILNCSSPVLSIPLEDFCPATPTKPTIPITCASESPEVQVACEEPGTSITHFAEATVRSACEVCISQNLESPSSEHDHFASEESSTLDCIDKQKFTCEEPGTSIAHFAEATVRSTFEVCISQNPDLPSSESDQLASQESPTLDFIDKQRDLFHLTPTQSADSFTDEYPSFNSCTLLSAFHADTANGLIDVETRDLLIRTLVESAIPRNLSDCSSVSVHPQIRKMYAWGNNRQQNRTDVTKQAPDKVDLEPSSENQAAHPGNWATIDSPSSSMSHCTVESSTTTGGSCDVPGACATFSLPDVDHRDQVLAWAMSNLDVNQFDDNKASSDDVQSTEDEQRRSRDRSLVATINSNRIERFSLSTFMPLDDGEFLTNETKGEQETKPKRSSSLKSQRTSPTTPTQKVVRFADAFGLDLTIVHHVPDREVPPKVPASATVNLSLDTDESIAKLGAKQFGLCFAQPGASANFIRRVFNDSVCLEDAIIDMPRRILLGTVRVRSYGPEKQVAVRTTYNNWATFYDAPASYVQGSHDGATDRFSFSLIFPDTMVPGDRGHFAIRYQVHTGEQFWDNNYGRNYTVTCYAKATDLAGDGSWLHYM